MIPTIKVKDDNPSGFKIINAADFNGEIHQPFDGVLPDRADGPTLEDYVRAGYQAKNYPPDGYSEVASEGLTKYRALEASVLELLQSGKADVLARVAGVEDVALLSLALETEAEGAGNKSSRKAVLDALALRLSVLSKPQ